MHFKEYYIYELHKVNKFLISYMHIAIRITAENVEWMLKVEKQHYRVWKTIAKELRINTDTLNTIAEIDDMNDQDRFYAVIDKAESAPTLETLTKILRSSPVISAVAGKTMMKLYNNYIQLSVDIT